MVRADVEEDVTSRNESGKTNAGACSFINAASFAINASTPSLFFNSPTKKGALLQLSSMYVLKIFSLEEI